MRRVVVATGNAAKVAALARWLPGVEVVPTPSDVSPDAAEDGASFPENAVLKAEAVSARLPGEVVVATDGGLLVPGLGPAWDPLRTRRFAGEASSAADRARALLAMASGLRGRDRIIGWEEALAVAVDGRHVASWVAESPPGELATTLHESLLGADPGFWVPAVWRCPECGGKRLADLTPDDRATRFDHWMQLGSALSGWLNERADSIVSRPSVATADTDPAGVRTGA